MNEQYPYQQGYPLTPQQGYQAQPGPHMYAPAGYPGPAQSANNGAAYGNAGYGNQGYGMPQNGYQPQNTAAMFGVGNGAYQQQPVYQQPVAQPGQMQPAYQQPAPQQAYQTVAQPALQQAYQTVAQQAVNPQPYAQQPNAVPGAYAAAAQPAPGMQPVQTGFAPGQAGYTQQGYGNGNMQPQPGQAPYPVSYGEPAKQQKPPKKPVSMGIIVLAGAALALLLMILSLVTGVVVLKWLAAAAAAVSIVLLLAAPGIEDSTKLTMSVVLGAIVLVSSISALTGTKPSASTIPGGAISNNPAIQTDAPAAPYTDPYANTNVYTDPNAGVYTDPYEVGQTYTDPSASLGVMTDVAQPGQSAAAQSDSLIDNDAVKQLSSFFHFWQVNNHDRMVELCAPSWQKAQENPKVKLFELLTNRVPRDWTVEKISGSDSDSNRTVTVKAVIDKQNGRDPTTYRLSVMMVKEDDTWYVDPKSLSTSEAVVEEVTQEPLPTGTPEPVISGDTLLYYNPKGGSKYHADPNCKIVGEQYKPLAGSFRYSQINESPYKDLVYCNVCNAPAR